MLATQQIFLIAALLCFLVFLALLAAGRCVEGDYVVIVAGTPPGVAGSTNSLRIHRIGDSVNHRLGRTLDF